MALNIFRRHGSYCPGGRALHEMTYEADELRRSWKKCSCPIYASGTLSGRFKRKNTEGTIWEEARRVVAGWEAAQRWDGPAMSNPPAVPAPDRPGSDPGRTSIADAITAFLAVRGGAKIAPATLRKYRTFTKPPLGADRVANKVPFTDDELQRIIRACDQLEPVAWSNGGTCGIWTGEDVKDFIWVLAYTGLRISDAALFNISRLRGNDLFLRTKKNRGDVYTWIPDWLRDWLQALARERGGRPCVAGHSDRLETATDLWRRNTMLPRDFVVNDGTKWRSPSRRDRGASDSPRKA